MLNNATPKPLATYKIVKFYVFFFKFGKILTTLSTAKWKGNEVGQKEFFEDLAKEKGFHPLDEPHKWVDITADDIVARKVCYYVCFFFVQLVVGS